MPHSSRSCLARRLPSLPFACLRQLLSAHLGSDVATVFSSGPTSVRRLPTWDKMPGSFKDGDNVMSLRQFEDDEPLALVGATGHRLGSGTSSHAIIDTGAPVPLGVDLEADHADELGTVDNFDAEPCWRRGTSWDSSTTELSHSRSSARVGSSIGRNRKNSGREAQTHVASMSSMVTS